MNAAEIVLIDLSSIAHPIWHMSQAEPDPDHTSQQIVARVRAMTTEKPYAVICCDSGRSFRKDISDAYKANRPQAEAPLHFQIDRAKERLVADGYPVWAIKGFEADDLIASGVHRALAVPDATALIISADKDLLQLVGPRVRAMSVRDGSILGEDEVLAKFGVAPAQMRDYLTLVGDASDNVKGAKGIGPKKAADILSKFGTLDAAYEALDRSFGTSIGLPTSVEMSLREFRTNGLETARALITLRTDVEIPFEEIAAERVSKDAESFGEEEHMEAVQELPQPTAEPVRQESPASVEAGKGEATGLNGSNGNGASVPAGSASVRNSSTEMAVVHEGEVLAAPHSDWEKQLEPRSINEAINLAKHMHASRLFSAYGTPQGVLSTLMAGRELGMQAMASLRAFHVIDGKPTLSADTIRALILRSGKAKYFRCTSRTATAATFETQRGDEPPMSLTYTVEEAQQAGMVKAGSGWTKNPADMCVARAGSKLARLVYPDVVHGIYSPEEF